MEHAQAGGFGHRLGRPERVLALYTKVWYRALRRAAALNSLHSSSRCPAAPREPARCLCAVPLCLRCDAMPWHLPCHAMPCYTARCMPFSTMRAVWSAPERCKAMTALQIRQGRKRTPRVSVRMRVCGGCAACV